VTANFYTNLRDAPSQGDILLTGISRILADDHFSPRPWAPLDQYYATVPGDGEVQSRSAAIGVCLVMLTSHDCQIDKEWNRRVQELMKEGRSQTQAMEEAESDPHLDRSFVVSPLVDPADIEVDRGNLMAGRVVGYLPVPPSDDGLVPRAVVDLTYQCTVDRLDVRKVASTSDSTRAKLRYALVQLDALRAADLGFEVEAVTGRLIERVEIPRSQPLFVRLHLDDGSILELMQQPREPSEGAGRTGASLAT
jgi:hypothetical protein